MSDERLKEIEDSINLQLELCKQLKVDDEMLQEEKELYDYTIKLKNRISEAIRYLKNNKLYNFDYDEEEIFEVVSDKVAKDYLLYILKGDNNE